MKNQGKIVKRNSAPASKSKKGLTPLGTGRLKLQPRELMGNNSGDRQPIKPTVIARLLKVGSLGVLIFLGIVLLLVFTFSLAG